MMSRDAPVLLLVEGPTDRRFFERIILPRARQRGLRFRVVEWSTLTMGERRRIVEDAKRANRKYGFVADQDDHPCVSSKKRSLRRTMDFLADERIHVVTREIEGWYLAGLNQRASAQAGVSWSAINGGTERIRSTSIAAIDKESFRTRDQLLLAALELFDFYRAVRVSPSFRKVCQRLDLVPG